MRKSMIVMALAMACLGASAQEKLFNSASVQSPVINNDGTVTLTCVSADLRNVQLTASCYGTSVTITIYLRDAS